MALLIQGSKILPKSSMKKHDQVCQSDTPLSWYQYGVIIGVMKHYDSRLCQGDIRLTITETLNLIKQRREGEALI